MCGISGIMPFEGPKDSIKMEEMLQSISHRGPDQKIIFKNHLGLFGFLRLKIIDLSDKSNQPFASKDKKIQIIYNGEIYNFKKLKETYFSKRDFFSEGDGEIILHLYEKFGISFLDKIKGMFSICIIDQNIKKVFLIRDRFGIKPLYFRKKNKKIYFSSEIKGLIDKTKENINEKEAYRFFNQGLINSTDETWFKDIFQVKPSHYLEVSSSSKILEKKYYNIEDFVNEKKDQENKSFKFYINEFRQRLLESFDEHNYFDVIAGVHLSGGVDSAVLSALMNFNKKKFKSFTFDFEDKRYSELDYAKKISKSANIQNFSSRINESKIEDHLINVLNREYEPFSSLRILSQHNLYDNFKEECKVIFDGSGGDEIGAGYSYYLTPWYLDNLKVLSKPKLKKKYFKSLTHIKNDTLSNSQFIRGSFAQYKSPGSSTIDGSKYQDFSVYSEIFKNYKNNFVINKPFKSHLRNAQYADIYYLKLPRSLKYVDRSSMHNSIETRVPFLDHKVVEWSLQIPSKYKLLNEQQRIIMKYPFKDYVDKEVLFLNKRTIADPQSKWMKKNLKSIFFDLINSKNFNIHGFLNKNEVIKYFENFEKYPKHFNSFQIFQIFISELWSQKILMNKF